MRILFDHQIFLSQPFGGVSRYFSELQKRFSFDEHCHADLSALCVMNEYVNAPMSPLWLRHGLQKNGSARKASAYLNRLYSLVRVGTGAFDILHPTYYHPYFLKALGKKPFVLTVYDMTHEIFPQHFAPHDLTSSWKKMLVEKADRVIAISQSTKNDLVRFFHVDPERIEVTHLGGDMPVAIPEQLQKHYEYLCDMRYLLFVGKRGGYKNFDLFLEAVVSLLQNDPGLRLFCVGGGAFTREEEGRLKMFKVAQQVRVFQVPDEALSLFYAHALAFVFPSLYEGFGIPVVEAFYNGCPVILSDASSLPEVGGDAAIYFDPQDKHSILQSITRVVNDPVLRSDLKQRSMARASVFAWEKTAEATKKVYQKVLGS